MRIGPADLPRPASAPEDGGIREAAERMGKLYSPQALAQDILTAIDKRKAMVVVPRKFRMLWRAQRVAPVGFAGLMGLVARREQKKMVAG